LRIARAEQASAKSLWVIVNPAAAAIVEKKDGGRDGTLGFSVEWKWLPDIQQGFHIHGHGHKNESDGDACDNSISGVRRRYTHYGVLFGLTQNAIYEGTRYGNAAHSKRCSSSPATRSFVV